MKERMKKVTALCLAAALSVGTVLPVHAETVQDAQNAVDQLQQQKDSVQAEKTTVETELKKIAEISGEKSENLAMAIAVYMLGFSSYIGFSGLKEGKTSVDENFLKRIYAYAKGLK